MRADFGQDLRLTAIVLQTIRLLSGLVGHAPRDAMRAAHGKSFDNFFTTRRRPALLCEVHAIGLRPLTIRAILLRDDADCTLAWMRVGRAIKHLLVNPDTVISNIAFVSDL